jgi:hypothetical protein
VAQIYKKTGNLRAAQLLLGHTRFESTVRYLGIEVDDTLSVQFKGPPVRQPATGVTHRYRPFRDPETRGFLAALRWDRADTEHFQIPRAEPGRPMPVNLLDAERAPLVPSATTYAAFLIAVLSVQLVPGPESMLILSRGIGQGRRIAVWTVVGMTLVAGSIQLPLLALGVASVIRSSGGLRAAALGGGPVPRLAWWSTFVFSAMLDKDAGDCPVARGSRFRRDA